MRPAEVTAATGAIPDLERLVRRASGSRMRLVYCGGGGLALVWVVFVAKGHPAAGSQAWTSSQYYAIA